MAANEQIVHDTVVAGSSGDTTVDLSDREVVTICLSGGVSAYETLVRRYESRLCGYLYLLTADDELSRHLTRDTFVRAWRKLRRFDPDRSFLNWLFAIARKLLRRHRGKLARFPFPSAETTTDFRGPVPAPPADAGLGAEDRWRLLREALARLPADQREVLILKDIQGLRYAEIARILNLPPGAVASRVYDARRAMARACLTPDVAPPPD